MNETKFHQIIMYLIFFSLGVVLSGFMMSGEMFQELVLMMLGGMVFLFVSLAYNYIRGIDHMQEHHPDYKGEDLFDDGETESKL